MSGLLYIYIYIYIERERERASKKTSFSLVVTSTDSVLYDVKFIIKLDDVILDFSLT